MVSILQEFMEKRYFLERTKYKYIFDGGSLLKIEKNFVI